MKHHTTKGKTNNKEHPTMKAIITREKERTPSYLRNDLQKQNCHYINQANKANQPKKKKRRHNVTHKNSNGRDVIICIIFIWMKRSHSKIFYHFFFLYCVGGRNVVVTLNMQLMQHITHQQKKRGYIKKIPQR